MLGDDARLEILQKAVANANPLGFVAIQVSDLRWLIELAQRDTPDPNGDVATSLHSELTNLEPSDDAEQN